MSWTKETPIPGKIIGCRCCGGNKEVFPLDSRFAVGFGTSGVTKDGAYVYQESPKEEWNDCPTLSKFEGMAAIDPDHDWRMFRHGPLKGSVYQRHGDGKWVLISEDEGFA